MDTLVSGAGAGGLNQRLFFTRLQSSIDSVYFTDLDLLFGTVFGFPRTTDEFYNLDPTDSELTSEEWEEVQAKDTKYRGRILKFLEAINAGPTVLGFQLLSEAVFGVTADVYEVFRYLNGGITDIIGRTNTIYEFVVTPHRTDCSPSELRLFLHIADKLKPSGMMCTVNQNGLETASPAECQAQADSTYFELQKVVTGSLSWPLPYDPTIGQWVESGVEHDMPHLVFQSSQETQFDQLGNVKDALSSSSHQGSYLDKEATLFPLLNDAAFATANHDPVSALPESVRFTLAGTWTEVSEG